MKSANGKLLEFLEARLGSRHRGYRWFLLPLLMSSERELESILSIPAKDARVIHDALVSTFKHPVHVVGRDELASLASSPRRVVVQTGVPCIDELLDGGFRAGQVYQIFGPTGSGKTEAGYLAICSFLRHPFGKDTKVAVIDTEHSFRPERLVQHAGGNLDLNKVFIATCYSSPHLVTLLGTIDAMMRRGAFIPLLVVDSVMPASIQLYQDEPVKRQRLLLDAAERMWAISRDHGTCILFTNHAAGDLPLPSSSNVLLGYSDHAIHMRKEVSDAGTIAARVVKCTGGPERSTRFRIGPAGITS
ncbi:MAG: hypothetical protein GYA24_00620 [Candidatus Lokiarchaeota archaeon]|nr:hypothetical protein [Candidatus Lokiarchaeota archaeon]